MASVQQPAQPNSSVVARHYDAINNPSATTTTLLLKKNYEFTKKLNISNSNSQNSPNHSFDNNT
jgi:hypothetical protein